MGKFTSQLHKRVINRGPAEGFCVICGVFGKLTRDHVPPQGCNNAADIILRTFPQTYATGQQGRWTSSQGGTHFRTLCEKCNSYLLGTKYDPELVKLSNSVTNIAVSAHNGMIVLPSDFTVILKPQRIARAIVGHVLAANAVEETKAGIVSAPFPDLLRKYFLDETEALPREVDIYYWLYPSRRQVVIKGAAKMSTERKEIILGHILKFLPLGFWILWEKPDGISFRLPALVHDKGMGIDDMNEIRFVLSAIPPLDFPEAPADDEVVLMHDESTSVGMPRRK